MSWHIFKKDFSLLWPFAFIVALAYAARAWIVVAMGLFNQHQDLQAVADVLPWLTIVGMVGLIGEAVQQDAIPGVTQDWLTRPIRRKDLLLGKLLFILLAVHAPLFIIDVSEGIAEGLPLVSTLFAALNNGFYKLCLISLPVAMLASMSAGLIELFVGVFITLVILTPTLGTMNGGHTGATLASTGLAWLPPLLQALLGISAAAFILRRQYFKRASFVSGSVYLILLVVIDLALYLPWQPAFAIQQVFASQPGLSAPIALNYEPGTGRLKRPASPSDGDFQNPSQPAYGMVAVPLRLTGLAPESILFTDHVSIRMIDGNGQTLTPIGTLASSGRVTKAMTPDSVMHLFFLVPIKFYEEHKQQALRFEINYSFTLMQPDTTLVLPAVDGEIRTAKGLSCATRVYIPGNTNEEQVNLRCMTLGKPPSCVSSMLMSSTAAQQAIGYPACKPNYAPYGFDLRRELLGVYSELSSLLGKTGQYLHPVPGTTLAETQVVLQTWEAQDHFTRQLVIPELRLSDWEPEYNPVLDPRQGAQP